MAKHVKADEGKQGKPEPSKAKAASCQGKLAARLRLLFEGKARQGWAEKLTKSAVGKEGRSRSGWLLSCLASMPARTGGGANKGWLCWSRAKGGKAAAQAAS